jgi:hypothetical protein
MPLRVQGQRLDNRTMVESSPRTSHVTEACLESSDGPDRCRSMRRRGRPVLGDRESTIVTTTRVSHAASLNERS